MLAQQKSQDRPVRRRLSLLGALVGGLLLFAAAGAARADLVIVQKVDGGGQQGDMTIRIKDGKVRADLAQPVSMITDSATGETIVLQHNRKTFTRIPASQTKSLTEQLLKAQNATEPPKLEATGKTEVIDGHESEIYRWTVGALKMRFWVARDFPNAKAIQPQLDQLQQGGLSAVAAAMMPKPGVLPGVRLRTEMEMPGQKVTSTITSIKEEPVDPAIFSPPKDYTEIPVPLNAGSAE